MSAKLDFIDLKSQYAALRDRIAAGRRLAEKMLRDSLSDLEPEEAAVAALLRDRLGRVAQAA